MNAAVAGMIGYVLIQFAVGAWVSRRMTSEADYILAGRSLGTGLVAFSVFATWFGAEAIVASAGEIYQSGLSGALTDPFGYGAAVVVVGLLFAGRIWRSDITTFADLFARRYSPTVEKVFVLVLLPGSVLWAGAQIRAFGTILSSSSGLTLTSAITIAAVLVAAYSVVGGLLADAITDVVQGIAVIIGLLVLGIAIATALGGVSAGLAQVEPARLAVLGGEDSGLAKLEKLAVVLCGSIVSIELISRFLGARSVNVARIGTLIGGAMYLIVGLVPVFLGLVGRHLIPDLEASDQIVAQLAERYLPQLGFALFAGALISAILSVVHAALHAPAAQISHNIVRRVRPELTPKQSLYSVRATVFVLSIVAFVLALSVSRIKELVELASAFGSAGAFVAAIFAIFTRIGGPRSAIAAMAVGMVSWAAGRFVFDLTAPYLIALGLSTAAYLAMAMFEPASGRAAPART